MASVDGARSPSRYFWVPQRHPVNANVSQKPYVASPPLLNESGLFFQLARPGYFNTDNCGYIGLHQSGSAHRDGLRTSSTRDIKPDSVDWTHVKERLQDCESQRTCKADPSRRFFLSSFRVIDTATRRILPAPIECEYVAVSYVWGESTCQGQELPSNSWLPFPAPLMIEDAISSTRTLGFRYLRVDKYCIDQNSHSLKDSMIQNMDRIYMSATLTLVDATGSSSHDGLASVSPIRHPPKGFHIHGQELSVIFNIRSEVHRSKWNNRGWTYQEAILSRRRLVFAHSQVY